MKLRRFLVATLPIAACVSLGAYCHSVQAEQADPSNSADNPLTVDELVKEYQPDPYNGKMLFVRGLLRWVHDGDGTVGLTGLVDPDPGFPCLTKAKVDRNKYLLGRLVTVHGKMLRQSLPVRDVHFEDCNILSTSDFARQEPIALADLVNDFNADPDGAATRYENRLLFVRGRVLEAPQHVQHPVEPYYKLSLQESGSSSHVLECRLIEEQDARVTAGQLVVVRGWVPWLHVPGDPLWLQVCVLVERSP